MPTTTRTFRVFVSSTFEDLREERNILQQVVFPKLEQFCLEKGARFQALDLRWGVREEAGLDQKTMEICLAEIARCQKTRIKPNFIVLLGDRYGWRPLPARIQQDEFEIVLAHIGRIGERDFVVGWYELDRNANPPEYLLKPRKGIYTEWNAWGPVEKRIRDALRGGARAAVLSSQALVKYEASATHQEILKGLGETLEDRAHVFAFFRESAGGEDPDLTKLKDHLKSVLPERSIFPYSVGDHDRLCDDVERSLKAVIAETAERFGTQSEKASHDQFAEDRARRFKGRGTLLDAIEHYLNRDDRRPLVVYGPSGSGKSAILAVASSEKNAIRRFIGATPDSSSEVTLLRSLCRELGERFSQAGDLPTTVDELSTMFSKRLKLATAEQPVILVIDALDQLNAQDSAAAVHWLPAELPPHSHVLLSTTEIPPALRRAVKVVMEPLPVEDAGLALDSWLTEAARTLQPRQREKLLASFLQSGLPLYLKLAFEEARLWRSFDSLDECVLGDGLPGIIDRLFARLSEPANHGRILVGHALGYLTAARYGLTEDEILAVLTKDDAVWSDVVGERTRVRHDPPLRQLPVIVWSRLHLDLEPYLAERVVPGGTTVSFYHRQLAERVESTPFHHQALAAHFAGQSYWLAANVPNRRKLTELVRQQVCASLGDDAATVLTDLDLVSAKCAAELVFDLEEDYREAIAALPEAQAGLREEEQRQDELARWTQTLIECAKQKRLPRPEEIIKSVEPWSHERIEAETKRIAENPTRLDRLKAFAGFIEQELYHLQAFGRHPGFIAQHAFNSAPNGLVHDEARRILPRQGAPFLTRRWTADDRYDPKPALARKLQAHVGSIHSLSLSTSGRHAVCGTSEGTLQVWDLETGALLRVLEGHTSTIWSVSTTPDGLRAASGSGGMFGWPWDYSVRLWDLETGECLRVLEGHRNTVSGVSMTPDGRLAVSASFDYGIRLWDLEKGVCLKEMDGHRGGVDSICITADGMRAVSAGMDGTVRLWDLESGACLRVLRGHDERVTGVSVSSNNKRAVSVGLDARLCIWDLETGLRMRTISPVSAIKVSVTPDGVLAVTGSVDGKVHVWNLETGECLRLIEGHYNFVRDVSVTADGRFVVSGGDDGTLRLWSLGATQSHNAVKGHSGHVDRLVATPDGKRVVSAGGDNSVGVWDTAQETFRALRGHSSPVTALAITTDGRRAISGSMDHTLRVWELESGRCLRLLKGHTDRVTDVTLTTDGRAISGSGSAHGGWTAMGPDGTHREVEVNDYTLRVWDLKSGRCLRVLKGHTDAVCSVSVAADGRTVVSGSVDNTLRVWSVETGKCLSVLTGHTSEVGIVRITADGKRIISGGGLPIQVWVGNDDEGGIRAQLTPSDYALRVWDLESGECLRVLEGHRDSISGVCVASTGKRALSASLDKTLRLWELETGECLRVMIGHTDSIGCIGMTLDGLYALSSSDDKTLRIWDLETGDCLAVLIAPAEIKSFASLSQLIAIGTQIGKVIFIEEHNFPTGKTFAPGAENRAYEANTLIRNAQ